MLTKARKATSDGGLPAGLTTAEKNLHAALVGITIDLQAGRITELQAQRERHLAECDAHNEDRADRD